MVIINLKLCGLSVRRATLFGLERREYPVMVVRGLFFMVAVLKGVPVRLFQEAMTGLMDDPEWMIKNARSVRLHRRKVTTKIRAERDGSILPQRGRSVPAQNG